VARVDGVPAEVVDGIVVVAPQVVIASISPQMAVVTARVVTDFRIVLVCLRMQKCRLN
jgi:hypothetical protein